MCIGAHVAYHDIVGFGRRYIDVDPRDLKADIIYQLAALQGIASCVHAVVGYVKPHGALYNRIVVDERQAQAVVDAIVAIDPSLALLTLPGSVVGDMAIAAGLRVFREAFADRAYTPEGRLVPRGQPGSVLRDVSAVARRASTLVRTGSVESVDGTAIRIQADSVCVHGDSPGAADMARALRSRLDEDGIAVRAFARR